MTEKTEQKSISDFMDGKKPRALILVLEQLLAPDSPWKWMDGMRERWAAYEHLTLEDFKRDCEWDEQWYAVARYGISVCSLEKRIPGVSTLEEAREWQFSNRELPEVDENDLEEWFQDNPPERSYRDSVDVRVNISNLRLKEVVGYGQK